VTGPMIPADAMEKATEKGSDYYAGLTDEERAGEGLPPRETPKGNAAPGDKANPVPEPSIEEENEEEEESIEEQDAATDRLFAEIVGLREDVTAAIGKADAPTSKKEEDALLAAALEHDDPVVRGLAERLQAAEEGLAETRADAQAERIGRQVVKDNADFKEVRASYVIDGKPMTLAQRDAVEEYILENPEVGSRVTIEQATRLVFPNAMKVDSPPSAKRPGGTNGRGGPVATIVDEASAGGTPAGPWKPRPNESVESAVQEAGRRLGWVR
jgi:hypothetical protein